VPAEGHDFAAALGDAIRAGDIGPAAASFAPVLNQYAALMRALGDYRRLATSAPAAPVFTATVKPGEPLPDAGALHRLLVALGDLPGDAPAPTAAVYDDTLRAAVARFQARHGLEPDGVIGKTTQDALKVPMSWRVRQIALALERLRWLPDFSGRVIAVNIPMFALWAWNQVPSTEPPALTMNVVVGRALDTRTPVFAERLHHVIFRPFWNVPTTIARGEILPAILKTPDYLARQDMELVRGAMDTSPVVEPTPDNLAMVGRDGLRIRQRPGPSNALGLVKFMFPNQNDVYMHDTPATQLFARARRDFSHGCIRVEDPTALASWVLGWTPADVRAAMNGTNNRRVDLADPVQVVIFYTTAAVDPATGAVRFAADVYRQDGPLDKAL
jgi:murein L,D-transpeptidase YcbB/YkuD